MGFIRLSAFGFNGLNRNRWPFSAATDAGDVCRAEVGADFGADLEADFGADFEADFGEDPRATLETEPDPLDDVGSAKFGREVEAACAYKKTKFLSNESN